MMFRLKQFLVALCFLLATVPHTFGQGKIGGNSYGVSGKLVSIDSKAKTLTLRLWKNDGTFNSPGATPIIKREDDGTDWILTTYRISPETRYQEWPDKPSTLAQVEKFVGKRIIVVVGIGKPALLQVQLWANFVGARGAFVSVDKKANTVTVDCVPLAEDFIKTDVSRVVVTAKIDSNASYGAYSETDRREYQAAIAAVKAAAAANKPPPKPKSGGYQAKSTTLDAFVVGDKVHVTFTRLPDGSYLMTNMVIPLF